MKIQSYLSYQAFAARAEKFWLKEEAMNSLFWEFSEKKRSGFKPKWMGNIFHKKRVIGSALITEASYILTSMSDRNAIEHLVKYLIPQNITLKGITGPQHEVKNFAKLWNQQNAAINLNVTQSFSVLLSPAKFSSVHSSSKIVKVSNLEWPRVLVWAKAFANESNPKLNQHQTIKLAKQMKEDGQLFVLKNIHGQTQAMGGFGRFTPNASVINMVYVNPEKRKRGVATDLTLKLLEYSKASGYEKSILFSDYLMDGNLYKNIGFLEKGLIQEIAFEAMT